MSFSARRRERIGIFISHRHQDRHVADMLRDQLTELSRGCVDIFYSPQINAGESYREWIRRSIRSSDVLMLLLTQHGPLSDWCSYEVGRFLQKCEETRSSNRFSSFICLKSAHLAAPPGPIEEFQAVNALAEPLGEFYIDLLEKGTYTGGRFALRPYSGFHTRARDLASDLATVMSPAFSRLHFHGRVIIEYHDGNNCHDDPKIIICDQIFAEIAGHLGCPYEAETLGKLRATVADTPAATWLEELDEFVAEHGHSRSPVLTTFQDCNGIKYIPIISQLNMIDEQAQSVELMFIVMSDALQDILELEKCDILAMRQYEIIKLLRMGRRFRYDIVDPFLHDIESAEIFDKKGQLDEPHFRKKFNMYFSRLERLMQEGSQERYRTYSFTSDVLDLPDNTYLQDLYSSYSSVDLNSAIEAFDLHGMRRALKAFRTYNKKFMLIAAESYLRKLDEMKPRNIHREEVIGAAFALEAEEETEDA